MIDRTPPQPIPDDLMGEKWQFATLKAIDLIDLIRDFPIPIINADDRLLPENLGLAPNVPIPGAIVYAGKNSMPLSRWIAASNPVSLDYQGDEVANLGGLILSSGSISRWVMMTFNDAEVTQKARLYETRKSLAKGLHFLIVAPDDSGMTYTGFWLLSNHHVI